MWKTGPYSHYGTKHADKYKNLTDAEWARAADGLLVKLQSLMITCQLSFAYLPQIFNQTSMHLFKPKTDWKTNKMTLVIFS